MTAAGGDSAAPRSGAQIQESLRAFVQRWHDYTGGERAEAQSFLNELIDCYGVDRRAAGMRFEYHLPGVGFMDMFWPGRALFEMKAPDRSPKLEEAQPQAERYWRASDAPGGSYDAVRYMVLSSFHRILVWDMRRPPRPAASLALDELADHYEALLFLAGESVEASFVEHHRELTRNAAELVALIYQSLKDRAAAPLDEIQRFTMQCVWTMFAEDLGMIGDYPLQRIAERLLREQEPNVARDLGFLFRVLNQKGDQNRKGRAGRHPVRQRRAVRAAGRGRADPQRARPARARRPPRLATGRPDHLRLAHGGRARPRAPVGAGRWV